MNMIRAVILIICLAIPAAAGENLQGTVGQMPLMEVVDPFTGKKQLVPDTPTNRWLAGRKTIEHGVLVDWSGVEEGRGRDGRVYWREIK